MPPRKSSKRGDFIPDWDASGTDDGHGNGSGRRNSKNRDGHMMAGGLGDSTHSNDNDNSMVTNGGKSRQNKGGSSGPRKQTTSLDTWTQIVAKTAQQSAAFSRITSELENKLMAHMDDIKMVDETKERVNQLEQDCLEKDKQISDQAVTITILKRLDLEAGESIKREKQANEKQREDLDKEWAKLEKRVEVATAQQKLIFENEFKRQVAEQDQTHKKRTKELENDFARQKDENGEKLAKLEGDNRHLRATVDEQKESFEEQSRKLQKSIVNCDVLERAIASFQEEKRSLEAELEAMKTEFALSSKSTDEFQQRFREIFSHIERISSTYFNDMDVNDLPKVHEQLVANDLCFSSVPIDKTDDSRDLRIAHAQRIISGAISECIWKPLSSDCTIKHPQFHDFLGKLLDQIDKLTQGGRAASFWAGLTNQALQCLPPDSFSTLPSDIKDCSRHIPSTRAEEVISRVLSVLSLLVKPSDRDDLQNDLLALNTKAMEVWDDAQASKLKITVNPSLELCHREQWRSQEFDPALPSGDNDQTMLENMSNTHPRIFTLFPRVVAREVAAPIKDDTKPPGSWPPESDQGPRITETCIHTGKGLPEWSSLVVRGKMEQEETNEALKKVLETAKKDFLSSRQGSWSDRRGSAGSSTRGPTSPTDQWNMAGARKIPDN